MTTFNGLVAIDFNLAAIVASTSLSSIRPVLIHQFDDCLRSDQPATLQRAEFDRLQRDIFSGKVKTVVLWKLDRLSRRLNDGVRCQLQTRARISATNLDGTRVIGNPGHRTIELT